MPTSAGASSASPPGMSYFKKRSKLTRRRRLQFLIYLLGALGAADLARGEQARPLPKITYVSQQLQPQQHFAAHAIIQQQHCSHTLLPVVQGRSVGPGRSEEKGFQCSHMGGFRNSEIERGVGTQKDSAAKT